MILNTDITLDGVIMNGKTFDRGVRLEGYEPVLGRPNRSDDGGPAPYGHRNNVLHFYDKIGLLLREHHSTYLISGIEFILEPSRWHFPTTSPYSERLRICGVEVGVGMTYSEFAREAPTPFKPHLGHAWYLDGEQISIQFEVYKPKTKTRSAEQVISGVCIGFRGAHRKPGLT